MFEYRISKRKSKRSSKRSSKSSRKQIYDGVNDETKKKIEGFIHDLVENREEFNV